MKKMLSLTLALLLIFSALPAQAEGADIRANLPNEIHAFFTASSFNGCTIYPQSFVVFDDVAFVVASEGSAHALYGFEKKNGAWVYWLKNSGVLPQVKGQYLLGNAKGSKDMHTDQTFLQDTLCISLLEEGLDYHRYVSLFSVNSKGQWLLTALSTYLLQERGQTSTRVYPDHIAYYNEADLIGNAWGVVETNLRYCHFSAFPATLQEARDVLSSPPEIPYGSQLSATKINFTGGQKFDVYSGPGTAYERGANGKARVSTNDWIQVFGQENDYILIQYDISSDQMRFGYIPASALPKGAAVPALQFDDADAIIHQNTFLTDDPLKSQTRIRSLSAGEEGVKWLATMGNWVYVEIENGSRKARGFVPASAISQVPKRRTYSASFANDAYTAEAAVDVSSTGDLAAVIYVSGPRAWFEAGASPILGYQLYANHVPVAAPSATQQTMGGGAWSYAFSLNASLPQGASVLGLCPIYANGQRANETILIPLNP